jgi:hypothetical protein
MERGCGEGCGNDEYEERTGVGMSGRLRSRRI